MPPAIQKSCVIGKLLPSRIKNPMQKTSVITEEELFISKDQ
uniref:Uncharacterized protein n=1 Tax=Arundo donax TaxID=35708 RepID=A0A0A8ZM26_ARUDO